MRAATHYAALALADGFPDAAEAVAVAGLVRRRRARPALRRGGAAPRRHRVHLGARPAPVPPPGEGRSGRCTAIRPGTASGSAGWSRRRSGGADGRHRPADPGRVRRLPRRSCGASSPSTCPTWAGPRRPAPACPSRPRTSRCCAGGSPRSTTPATCWPASARRRRTRSSSGSSRRSWPPPACPTCSATRSCPARSRPSAPRSSGRRTCRRWPGATTSGPSCSASRTPAATSPSLQTRAQLDGDDYVVDGQKVWSTWAGFADYGYLLARTEPDPGPAGITAFMLDMRSPGVEMRPLREMTGTADFSEVFLDGVRVPVANVIGAPGEGWRVANASLAAERGGVGELSSDGVDRRGSSRLARDATGGPAARRSRTAPSARRSARSRRGAHPAGPRATAWRRGRCRGATTVWDAPADEDLVQRAQPRRASSTAWRSRARGRRSSRAIRWSSTAAAGRTASSTPGP